MPSQVTKANTICSRHGTTLSYVMLNTIMWQGKPRKELELIQLYANILDWSWFKVYTTNGETVPENNITAQLRNVVEKISG